MAKRTDRPRLRSDLPIWYAGGLRFDCLPDCARCCTNHDDYCFVYLDGDDGPRLARHLGLTIEEFETRYTTLEDGHRVLLMDRPDCPFLEEARCTVYAARPVQCRTFPFWAENLKSRRAWRRLASFCPGIDEGDVHDRETIEAAIASRRS